MSVVIELYKYTKLDRELTEISYISELHKNCHISCDILPCEFTK